MSDKKNIEDWTKSNKSLFDDKELPIGHRDVFEGKLDSFLQQPKIKKSRFKWYNIAAIFVVGFSVVSSTLYFSNNGFYDIINYASADDFQKVESHYSKKIKEALVPVRSSNKYLSPEYRSFLKEMEKLDVENEKLKKILVDYPDDERILNSIIENYKSRLQLLEQLKVIMSNKQISKIRTNESI